MATDDAMMADDMAETGLDAFPEAAWSPPEGVTRHSGDPVVADADFFAAPPEEIGEVISAESTLASGRRPWKTASRVALSGLVAWAIAMGAGFFLEQANPADLGFARFLEGLIGLIVFPLIWIATRFHHSCSYVGKLGLARFRCQGDRSRIRSPEVFLFEDAAELRTSQTRHYHNGVYTGTHYSFAWTGPDGAKVFKLSGMYRGEKAPPKAKDPFHFADMAEGVWSAFLLDRSISELESSGSIRFNLSGRDWLAVGPGFLDISRKGATERLTLDDIGGVAIEQGVVKVRRADAKEGWFSSTGVYKFPYDSMANCRLFGLAYSKLVGK